jgi:hypothetical protein
MVNKKNKKVTTKTSSGGRYGFDLKWGLGGLILGAWRLLKGQQNNSFKPSWEQARLNTVGVGRVIRYNNVLWRVFNSSKSLVVLDTVMPNGEFFRQNMEGQNAQVVVFVSPVPNA